MVGGELVELLAAQHIGAAIADVDDVGMIPHDHKAGDGRAHVGFVLLILLAEHSIGILDGVVEERDQCVFIKRFDGFAVLFGAERGREQFAHHTFGDDVDSGAARNLSVVVPAKAIGDDEDAGGGARRFEDALEQEYQRAVLIRLAAAHITGVGIACREQAHTVGESILLCLWLFDDVWVSFFYDRVGDSPLQDVRVLGIRGAVPCLAGGGRRVFMHEIGNVEQLGATVDTEFISFGILFGIAVPAVLVALEINDLVNMLLLAVAYDLSNLVAIGNNCAELEQRKLAAWGRFLLST